MHKFFPHKIFTQELKSFEKCIVATVAITWWIINFVNTKIILKTVEGNIQILNPFEEDPSNWALMVMASW